jgi:transposase, IS5 family
LFRNVPCRPQFDIPVASFGYKGSIAICRPFGSSRLGKVTDSARFDSRMLRDFATGDNTASDGWVDTAYRTQANKRGARLTVG